MIAGEIGDKTVGLMQTTYGERPKNWLSGEPLRWVPKEGEPIGACWKIEKRSKIDYLLTTENEHKLQTPVFTGLPVWRNGRRTGLKILGP